MPDADAAPGDERLIRGGGFRFDFKGAIELVLGERASLRHGNSCDRQQAGHTGETVADVHAGYPLIPYGA